MSNEVFAQLVDAHYQSLYRFALSLARNSADAGDLVQQTFYIWATKGASLRETAKAKSWLFTTLYREFLRGRRRGGRETFIEDLPPGETDIAAEAVDQVAKLDGATVVAALQQVDEAPASVVPRCTTFCYTATNFLGHGTVNPKANESDD